MIAIEIRNQRFSNFSLVRSSQLVFSVFMLSVELSSLILFIFFLPSSHQTLSCNHLTHAYLSVKRLKAVKFLGRLEFLFLQNHFLLSLVEFPLECSSSFLAGTWDSRWSISPAQTSLATSILHRSSSKMASTVEVRASKLFTNFWKLDDKLFFHLVSLGKVLVHCMVGMSRSATCALAYLMIARKMSGAEAIRTVRMHRDIHPNEGFLQQLADLDNELRRDRLYYWFCVQSSSYDFFWEKLFVLLTPRLWWRNEINRD